MRTHEQVVISEFKGKWSRGEKESCPLDHSPDEQNCAFEAKAVKTRPQFATYLDTVTGTNRAGTTLRRVHPYIISAYVDTVFHPAQVRLICWYSDGKLFDSSIGFADVDAIYDAGGDVTGVNNDFSLLNMNNRAYISFHFRDFGDADIPMQVYDFADGTNVTRDALGLKPSSATTSFTEPNAGNVDAGQYVLAVAFETASGFITPPQAVANREVFTAAGNKTIKFNGIPLGPTGTVGRYLLASHVFPTIGADIDAYELFFIPINGHIEDNTTTDLEVNFFSTDLLDSAEYLKDLEETQVSVLGMCEYNGRMILWGDPNDPNSIKGSQAGKPESFSTSDSSLSISVNSLGQAKRCVAFRGNLMIHKERQTKVVRDNGLEPAEWEVVDVDSSVGAEIYSIGEVFYGDTTSSDAYILADRSGIYLFNGVIQKPALSYKIEDFWASNTAALFNRTQVKIDPVEKMIYVSMIVDDTTQTSNLGPRILFGDYSEGLDAKSIKWSEWNYYEDLDKSQWPADDNFIDWIQIVIDPTSFRPSILVPDQNFANLGIIGSPTLSQLTAEVFTSKYSTTYIGSNDDNGEDGIYHLGIIRARIAQNVNSTEADQCINVSVLNLEDQETINLGDWKVADQNATTRFYVNKEWLANVKDSAMRVVFESITETNGVKSWPSTWIIQKIRLYAKKIYNFRPLMKPVVCGVRNIAPVVTIPTGDNVPMLLAQFGTTHFTNETAISMADIDADGGVEQMSISVTPSNGSDNCNVTLASTTGITVVSGSNGSALMVIRGTLTNLNAALDNASIHHTLGDAGVTFTLAVIGNDLGNTGIGGALTDTKSFDIFIVGS